MRKLLCFNWKWLLVMFLLLAVVGCGAENEAPDLTASEPVEGSVESAYILGRWEVNNGRFGHKIFDFQEDGRLLIEDVETGEMIEMQYLFVAETSLILSGYEDFDGAATVAFFDEKMDFTITFDGNIFAELYVFTRVSQTS